jgi:uncharacterized iron-regulated membrane protein
MAKRKTGIQMRIIHRYLGFFLVDIMSVYAISGTVLLFRNTDYFKITELQQKVIEPNVPAEKLGQQLDIRRLKVTKQEGDILFFDKGQYNQATGEATFTTTRLPYILGKMTHLHKAKKGEPLYWLNIFFAASLLFFVISAFWMYLPKTTIFKKGLYFTAGGIVLTLLLLFV